MNAKYRGPIEEVKLVEKVKITRKQEEAIKEIKDKDYAINILALQKRPDHALATLGISVVAKLLYGIVEFEVQSERPKFQPGDIIIDLSVEGCPLIRVHTVGATEVFGTWGNKYQTCVHKVNARLATPEEIYWLETLNRDSVKDFRIGDVYIDRECRAEVLEKDRHLQLAQIWYADGDFRGLYPADAFKPFPKED